MSTYRLHRNEYANAGFGLFFIFLWLAGAYGWIANVVKVFLTIGDPVTGFFIARVVGVFLAPVGCVLGFL